MYTTPIVENPGLEHRIILLVGRLEEERADAVVVEQGLHHEQASDQVPVWLAITVIVGSSELRRTWRRITVRRGSPLSTAVRT